MKTWLAHLIVVLVAVFSPIQGMLLTVFTLIMCDLVFGITAAKKRNEAITSAGIRRTVTKLFVYEVALMICFLAETYLLSGVLPVSKIVAGVIGLAELKSVLESLNEISGKDLLAEAIKKLGSDNDTKE